MGVLVLTGGVTAAVLMNRTDEVSSELVDDIQPARAAAYQLQGRAAGSRDGSARVRDRSRPAIPAALLRRATHRTIRGRRNP
jgi:hypothetical protein